MLVLSILGVIACILFIIAIILLIVFLILKFAAHLDERFYYNFFRTSLVMLAAVLLVFGGLYWYDEATKSGGDMLNGLILMMTGGIIFVGLIAYTIWKTNLFYAILITLVQIGVAALLAFFGMIALIIAAGLLFLYILFELGSTQTVHVANED